VTFSAVLKDKRTNYYVLARKWLLFGAKAVTFWRENGNVLARKWQRFGAKVVTFWRESAKFRQT
jgi:hypothetical protein